MPGESVPTQGVPAWNPQGELVTIPAFDAAASINGYRPASPEDVSAAQAEEQYGGTGQGLAAAGEGALNALTFGTGTALLRGLGVTSKEGELGRKEAHPIAHGVGTALGIVAPMVFTMGAAGPAEAGVAAADYAAPNLIASAGRAVAGATKGVLPGVAGRVLPVVAAGATEGAIYTGSDLVERKLLGDPQLTWEKAATELGLGALFGGALAGGTEVAAKGLGKLITKATSGLESVAAMASKGDPAVVKLMLDAKHELGGLEEVAPGALESISASTPETAQFVIKNRARITKLEGEFPGLTDILSRATPETGQQILDNWGKLLKDPQARIDIGNSLTEAVNTAYRTNEDALREVFRDVRPAEIERLASRADPAKASEAFSGLRDKVDALAKQMRAEPDLFQQGPARELELIRDGMDRDVPASAADSFNLLNRTKQLVDQQAKFGKMIPPEWRRTASALKELRSEFRNALEDTSVWGEAGARQADFNSAYNAYLTARRAIAEGPANQKLMQKVIRSTGAVDFEANPRSVNSWINLMADGRGGAKSDSFGAYLKASKDLADQMEASGYANAGKLRQTIHETAERANDIRQRGTITQIVKMLQGHEILSSGPAVPMGQQMALAAAKRLPGGVGHIVGAVHGTISKVRNPAVMVNVLSTLEKLAKKASAKLSGGADAIFRTGASGAAGGAAASGTERFAHGGVVAPERFHDVAGSLRDYGGNLDRLASDVSAQTSALHDHAPATADAAHAFAARVVSHLGGKLPQDAGPRKLLDVPFEPPPSELSAYNRHHEIAERGPAAALEHLRAGTLHPDHLAASQAIYPKLHAEAQQMVAERLAEHLAKKEHVPIALRSSLGLFLGSDLEHATTPQAILSAQLAYAQPAPQAPPPGKPSRQTQTGFGERSATSSQGNETRMRKV